ncbi:hypothetical protein DQ04_12721010, partial [Trypanosoma grayi]|uniref:hypothetical protein n=1 Tax=Trypanosoma grayi TaxID=71804 RepID=UPI0004F44509
RGPQAGQLGREPLGNKERRSETTAGTKPQGAGHHHAQFFRPAYISGTLPLQDGRRCVVGRPLYWRHCGSNQLTVHRAPCSGATAPHTQALFSFLADQARDSSALDSGTAMV